MLVTNDVIAIVLPPLVQLLHVWSVKHLPGVPQAVQPALRKRGELSGFVQAAEPEVLQQGLDSRLCRPGLSSAFPPKLIENTGGGGEPARRIRGVHDSRVSQRRDQISVLIEMRAKARKR